MNIQQNFMSYKYNYIVQQKLSWEKSK